MKKLWTFLVVLLMLGALFGTTHAQLLVENFNYGLISNPDITLVSPWARHSGTQGPGYNASSLVYSGYASSGIGGRCWFTRGSSGVNDGDVNTTFTAVTTTSNVYASFLVNLDSARTTADYFFHLAPSTIGTTFRGRVFARNNGAGWSLGLSKSSETRVDDVTVLNFGQTYLIVMRYAFNTTSPDDDVVTLYAYATGIPLVEPGLPLLTIGPVGSGTGADPADIGSVAIRQGTNTPTGYIDGIRIGTSWADVLPPPPLQYRSFAPGPWNSTLTWETSLDAGLTWGPATATPTFADGAITVRAPHIVTVTSSVVVDEVTIEPAGGAVQINGGVLFTVNDGVGNDVVVNGMLVNFGIINGGTGSIAVNGGVFQIEDGSWGGNTNTYTYDATGTLVFNNSSGFYGVNPDAVWWPDPISNVTVQNIGGVMLNVSRTVTGLFQAGAGVQNTFGNNLFINGTLQMNGGGYFDNFSPIYGGSSTLVYNTTYGLYNEWTGSGMIAGYGVPQDVVIQNSSVVSLPGNRGLAGNLTLTDGIVVTGPNTLTVGGDVTRVSGHVNGRLQLLLVQTGGVGSKTWHIGDAMHYTPVFVEGTAYSGNFPLTISTTTGEHPDVAGSGLDAAKSVNRFYTINGTPTGPSDITFNFVAGDVDGGANTAAFEIAKYDLPTWSPVTVGTRTATSTQATGVTSFSDFAIGEAAIVGTATDIGIVDLDGTSRPAGIDETGRFVPQIDRKKSGIRIVVGNIRARDLTIKGNASASGNPDFEVVVENFGPLPVTSYDVGFDIDASPETPVSAGPLAVGDRDTIMLTWTTPTVGSHTFQAYTVLAADTNSSNDSSGVFSFEVLGPEVIFNEGFNAYDFPPSGWTVLNEDTSSSAFPTWYRDDGFVPLHEGTAYAAINYLAAENVGNGPIIDDWLITPNTGGLFRGPTTVDSLSFWVRHSGPTTLFPDSLEILVSTTGTSTGDFTTVLDYIRVPGGGVWTKYTYELPSAASRYIAFRYKHFDGGFFGTGSNYMGLDDVRITRYTLAPAFLADPTTINFGSTVVGDTATSTVTVYNTGTATLNIATVASDDANFEVDPTSGVIAAGDSADFTVRFIPVSLGAKSGNIVFTHDAATSPDTVTVSGTGTTSTPTSFLSVPPETLYATVGGKFPKPVKRPKPGKPIIMPNWANLMSEGVAQGGFAPGTVESDSAGGMVIGVSHMFLAGPNKWKPIKDSANVRAWARITKYDFKKNIGKGFNVMQKTLNAKGQVHTGGPRGFDLFANGKPMKKQLTKLLPAKQNNVMFAELLALKFNIAMSALGKIPAGFGDLIFERTGNPFDQMSVSEISQLADSMMTYHGGYVQEDYDSLLSTVGDINRAFVGALDTLSWIQADSSFPLGKLVLAGVKDIDSVSYLKLPNPFVATVTTPSSYEVESEEEMDFEDDEEFESQPIAAKLYQNYPNPFNPTTTLSFRLREDSKVSLKVYNMLGQEVASLLNNEEMEEGVQVLQFNAADLSSGIYFYRIQAEGLEDNGFKTVETGKMVLLK